MYLDLFDRNPYGTNCWLLAADGADEAVAVDPGFEPEAVRSLLDAAGKRLAAVLLTHAHLDHAQSAGTFAGEAPVYVHVEDRPAFDDYTGWGGMSPVALDAVRDFRTFTDGDRLELAGFGIEVVHTPGHTPGSSCFRVGEDVVYCSGDLVFVSGLLISLLPVRPWHMGSTKTPGPSSLPGNPSRSFAAYVGVRTTIRSHSERCGSLSNRPYIAIAWALSPTRKWPHPNGRATPSSNLRCPIQNAGGSLRPKSPLKASGEQACPMPGWFGGSMTRAWRSPGRSLPVSAVKTWSK